MNGCGQSGHGVDGAWCQLCCWTLFPEHCPWMDHREGERWASWCPFCGAGVSNEHEANWEAAS